MFPFFLDDDMMDYVQPNRMFDIVVTDSPGPDADGKVDLQLIEVDAEDVRMSTNNANVPNQSYNLVTPPTSGADGKT